MVCTRPGEYMGDRSAAICTTASAECPVVMIERAGIRAMQEYTVSVSGICPCRADVTACTADYDGIAEGIYTVGPRYICREAYMVCAGLCISMPWAGACACIAAVPEVPEAAYERAGVSCIEMYRVIYIV